MNPIQQAISALEEIISAGKAAKEALDKDLPVGDPVHPVSGRLTWPLSSCLMAVESLRSLQKEAEGVLPFPKYIYHNSEMPGEDELFEFVDSGAVDEDCPHCERLYTADQLRTAVAAALGRGAVARVKDEMHWQDIELLTSLVNSNRIAPSESSAIFRLLEQVAAPEAPAGVQVPQGPVADLRNAKWLDPECAEAGCCQSLRFKSTPEAPAQALCRNDGRCQYAIDHGAEGIGSCPAGKCAMPTQPTQAEAPSERAKAIMEQAQVFASAWSLVGGRFDSGSGLEDAEREKAELERMVRAALATQQAVQAEPAAWLRDDFGDCVTTQKKRDMTEHNGLPGRRLAEHYNIPLVPYIATPPAPGQVERELTDDELADLIPDDALIVARDGERARVSMTRAQLHAFARAVIRAARSSEGGGAPA